MVVQAFGILPSLTTIYRTPSAPPNFCAIKEGPTAVPPLSTGAEIALTSVTLGRRISTSDETDATEWIRNGDRPVELRKTRLAKDRYALEVDVLQVDLECRTYPNSSCSEVHSPVAAVSISSQLEN